ncbi:hypothetical protein DOTSEDRAFT_60757 [Dothistroma septosporum NZE10]|uniref:Uncharacterized protein n=1 Tax=Dothistroma septosporum (strain NZE10 / CBS 128990) TaxID=675120 RepID=N1PRP0_DOTSN|nr:hypothetical protein DOTSEDRAFT_60757 [Dothistroma septosporum NZE10]
MALTEHALTEGGPPDLRFIHYNDVYHVEAGSREPVGGIARFKTICKHYQNNVRFKDQPEVLTFFSGDAFNPSLESSVTKGKHMVGALNAVDTTVACLGNHDLDFGVKQFEYLAAKCTFPWLCANVLDPALGEEVPLGNCKRTVMVDSSNGIKIGVIGIVEREWLDTINTLPPDLRYLSASATVMKLAPRLRANGAEMVVVVSHQREPNDNKLATKIEPGTVDIVLGGHDHYYNHSIINGTHVLRSGSDFKQLSYIQCRRRAEGKGWDFDIVRRDIINSIPEEPIAVEMVDKITASLRPKLEKPIGYTLAPLDARFTTVRLKESNMGNFVCDLMRLHYLADCCIMASGTIRGDQIYPPGLLKVKDIMNCFPFEDPCVVVKVKGKEIVKALENGVSTYPALEGRFPQVSNITFTITPAKPSGQRCSDVQIGGQPIDLEREYKVATRDYMARGKDGFSSLMLKEHGGAAESIVSDENGMLISMILRQYFMSLKVLGKWRNWSTSMAHHFGKIQDDLHEVHPVKEPNHLPQQATAPSNENKAEIEKVEPNGDARKSLVGTAQKHARNASDLPAWPAQSVRVQQEDTTFDSDSDDDEDSGMPATVPASSTERELRIVRKVMRRWRRSARIEGHADVAANKHEAFDCHWTKGIAPRIEGRIKFAVS